MTRDQRAPVRVALVNDYELVLRGVAHMLRPYRDRVTLVELDARMPVSQPVDLALYDTHGRARENRVVADEILGNGLVGKLVVYSWEPETPAAHHLLGGRATGFVSKGLGAADLVTALERVHREPATLAATSGSRRPARDGTRLWPGRQEGLTQRESEIVCLITQGLSNQAIADLSYLSINSVKSYIRTAYRKMGVATRSQAVLWGVQHGFEPDTVRVGRPDNVHQLRQPHQPGASHPIHAGHLGHSVHPAGRGRAGTPRHPRSDIDRVTS